MPKVTLPLGSSEAHGRIGQSLIFQGNIVKAYAKPVIEKVPAQLLAQDKFQSITKTTKVLGSWGRASLTAMIGPAWFSMMVTEANNYWLEAETIYMLFPIEARANWFTYAPYIDTALDRGLVFYVCTYAIYKIGLRVGYEPFIGFGVQQSGHVIAATFWSKDLTGVFGEGVYSDSNEGFSYEVAGGLWAVENDTFAMDGSFHITQNQHYSTVQFSFIGVKFGIIYKQFSGADIVQVRVDQQSNFTFSQNGVDTVFQKEWTSPVYNKGLHRVLTYHTGLIGSYNFDGLIVYG